jgi:glycosyltransferase involved in cell wall biosynthesis
MRILFVSGEYPPITDGIGAYVASVTPALAARGHAVHVLSCMPGQATSDALHDGVRVHRRGELRLPGLEKVTRAPQIAARVRRAVSCWAERRRLGERFDVVEAPDWMAEGLLLGGTPMVAHLHTPYGLVVRVSRKPLTRAVRGADRLERMAVRRAVMITAPSRLLLETLRDWVPAGVETRVVPYPVDLDRWAGVPPVADTRPTVLSVGRLEPRKAPEVLVDAAAELPGAEVVFVGRSEEDRDGLPYRSWLERRAATAGVTCRFVDHVSRNELPELYAQARVVALPSLYDNFPMVGLEALASGRPVVCTDATGTAELLAGSGAGAVVPKGDAAALAAALRPFLSDTGLAAAAGREARSLVMAECSPERVAERREACYADVVGREAGGA